MLKIGSIINIKDNSGALNIKVLSFRRKKTCLSSSLSIADMFLGVIQDFDVKKKKQVFKKKAKVVALIVTIKKKYAKKNGIFIRFSYNRCIPLKITRFTVPVASKCLSPVFYEMKYIKQFKVIYKASRHKF